MEFLREDHWSGLPFPSLGYLSNPGIETAIGILLQFMLRSVLPVFPSKSFIVSGFTFRSLIHFFFLIWY